MTEEPHEHNPVEQPAPFDVGMQPTAQPEVRPSIDLRQRGEAEAPPSWGGLDLCIVFGALAVTWLASAMVLGVIFVLTHAKTEDVFKLWFWLPPQLLMYGVLLLTMYLLVSTRTGRPFWQEIRWNWPRRSWAVYIPCGFVLAIVVGRIESRLTAPKNVPMLKYLNDATSAWVMGLIAVLAAPIIEELFFRGFLYPLLKKWLHMWPAIVVVGLFFGFIHAAQLGWAPGYILLMSFVGFVLTAVRALTRSVGSSFTLHTFYNLTIFLSMWIGTDHFRHMEKMSSMIFFKH